MSKSKMEDNFIPISPQALSAVFEKIQPKEEVTPEDKAEVAFYELHESHYWKYLKELVESLMSDAEANINLSPSDSASDIGFKYLAVKTAKAYLSKVLSYIETSYEVRKQRGNN